MRTIRDIERLDRIPVLVRAALNVPLENGKVGSDYRLQRALPTIHYLRERGAKIILMSHLGEGGTETLRSVATALKGLVGGVTFCPETVGKRARAAVRELLPERVLVLENLRRNAGERKNSLAFAEELATLADVFVQDSFDTAHRAHASIVSVPKLLPSYAGLLFEEEIEMLSQARKPKRPALAVIGGAKFSTKEAVLERLLKTYDYMFVGGALANDFLRAAGQEVGKSLMSDERGEAIRKMLSNPRLVLPLDSRVVKASSATDGAAPEVRRHTFRVGSAAATAPAGHARPDEIIVDHGPATSLLLADLAHKAQTVLWNGPLGNYERGFIEATGAFARAVIVSGARSIVGGGDTIAALERLGLLSRFPFVSTGGGAMVEYLIRGTLPGIEALESYWSA